MRRWQGRRGADAEAGAEPEPWLSSGLPVSGAGGGLRLPRHRGTTAHIASIYPFHGGQALHSVLAPYVGINVTDGASAWTFDPFELYGRHLGGGTVLTNSNMLVLGEPGNGKSAAVKTMLYRQAAFYGHRRYIAISDPKGEYGPLAARLEMPVIKLRPGGSDRLNPLDPGPADADESRLTRQALLVGLLGSVMRRDLTAVEELIATTSIELLDDAHTRQRPATLVDLARLLSELPPGIRHLDELALLDERELAAAVTAVRLALSKLLTKSLRGMFDGHSTVGLDQATAQGVVIDLSAVFANRDALPLVQMATTSWLAAQMAGLRDEGRRGILVDDEVWATMASERAARHLQERLKLCRHFGFWNILISHRLSDFWSQADDGTAAAKIAKGLLADIQTRVVFRQATDQLAVTREMLEMNSRQIDLLPRLTRGRAVWMVAGRNAIVQHVIGRAEHSIVNTDEAMAA